METQAVLMNAPRNLTVDHVPLKPVGVDDVVVEIAYSGISTGTEKLFWTGDMPPFPGMGYPLVPGYESVGEVVEAGTLSGRSVGDRVFVPGADCFDGVRGLFGGAAACVVTSGHRTIPVDTSLGADGALLALAATARHAVAGMSTNMPELIVGHGVVGRLLARITCLLGGKPPTVWELDPQRRIGEFPYPVLHPDADNHRNYKTIYDASGDSEGLNALVGRLAKGGEVVLAGFYPGSVSFAFAPAFMKEARFRIAAEWTPQDMLATRMLIEEGHLSLDGLITHTMPAADAGEAYVTAFDDTTCLKMMLDWKGHA